MVKLTFFSLGMTAAALIVFIVFQFKKPYTSPYYWKSYNYWNERNSQLELLPIDSNDIVMLGNSLTDACEWAEFFNNPNVKNRGIGGDNITGALQRIGSIIKGRPAKIFIDIGVNDLLYRVKLSTFIFYYDSLISKIQTGSPGTKIYLQSILPTRGKIFDDLIPEWNKEIKKFDKRECVFIDTYPAFADSDGQLKKELTFDGIHLVGQGYEIWKNQIAVYLNQ